MPSESFILHCRRLSSIIVTCVLQHEDKNGLTVQTDKFIDKDRAIIRATRIPDKKTHHGTWNAHRETLTATQNTKFYRDMSYMHTHVTVLTSL